MTIQDKEAGEALASLLEKMRQTGRLQGRIEITVDGGRASKLRIVELQESQQILQKN